MRRLAFALLAFSLALASGHGPELEASPLAQRKGEDVCLARWEWYTGDPNGPYWRGPFMRNLTGSLDLRSIPQMGTPGPIARGWGLFAYDQPMGWTGMHCMGGDLDAAISKTQADTIALVLDKSMDSIEARTMRGLIEEVFTSDADPTGERFARPMRDDIYLGGYGWIGEGQAVSKTSYPLMGPAYQLTDVIIRDEFTGMANGEDIGGRTPSPTNTPGNAWIESGANEIEGDGSNQIKANGGSQSATIDTDEIDLYASVEFNAQGADNRGTVYARNNNDWPPGSATFDGYAFNWRTGNDTLHINKIVDGTTTQLDPAINFTIDNATTYKYSIRVNGTTIDGLVDDNVMGVRSDSAVDGITQGGTFAVFAHFLFNGGGRFDNFEVAQETPQIIIIN